MDQLNPHDPLTSLMTRQTGRGGRDHTACATTHPPVTISSARYTTPERHFKHTHAAAPENHSYLRHPFHIRVPLLAK